MPIKVTSLKVGILEELIHSQQNSNVVGIFFNGEDELFITAVVDIKDQGDDKVVYFKEHDLHGNLLERNPVLLSDIQGVIHFYTLYDEPVYVKLRERKLQMRSDIAA